MPVPVAATQLRHLLSRFSYGVTPRLVTEAEQAGGGLAWFEAQLRPASVPDAGAAAMLDWFPYLRLTPGDLWDVHEAEERYGWDLMHDLAGWTTLRRMRSQRQLVETMVDFWSNLFHVPGWAENAWPHRIAYDRMIRGRALGRFDDLLVAAVLHPAMGCYLDNAVSTKTSVNENLGRELLELHSVGVDAGYTEDHVRHSAYILTGYRVDMWDSWASFYATDDHWVGPVSVLGFQDPNGSRDGRAMTVRYLRYLAHHPATARRIARRLCVRFVSDTPSVSIVSAVASAFTSSGTDIRAALRALVTHPHFAASVDAKVRTPAEDTIAAYRLLGARPSAPTSDDAFARAVVWQLESQGNRPFDWPAPNGFPEVGAAWTSVGRVLLSLDTHLSQAGGWWPSQDVTYPTVGQRLPTLPARFDAIVDHVARRVLQRPAGAALQTAARQRVEVGAATTFDSADDFGEWRMTLLLATVLDSPAHAAR